MSLPIVHRNSRLCSAHDRSSPALLGLKAGSTVTIAFKLADVKLESSEAYLLKLGKSLSWDFEVIDIICKNGVLNIH